MYGTLTYIFILTKIIFRVNLFPYGSSAKKFSCGSNNKAISNFQQIDGHQQSLSYPEPSLGQNLIETYKKSPKYSSKSSNRRPNPEKSLFTSFHRFPFCSILSASFARRSISSLCHCASSPLAKQPK